MMLLRRGGLVTHPVLNQEHPLTLHVILEINPFGDISAGYSIIFSNTVLV